MNSKYLLLSIMFIVVYLIGTLSGILVMQAIDKYHEPEGILKDFQSIDDALEWLKDNDIRYYISDYWCVQRAETIQRMAEEDGYRINLEKLTSEELMLYFNDDTINEHVVLSIIADDYYYLIEPIKYDVISKSEIRRGTVSEYILQEIDTPHD